MKGKKATIGWIIFGFSMFIFLVYTLFFYIPAIQKDLTNSSGAIESALVVGLICGIVGTIGLLIEKYKSKLR